MGDWSSDIQKQPSLDVTLLTSVYSRISHQLIHRHRKWEIKGKKLLLKKIKPKFYFREFVWAVPLNQRILTRVIFRKWVTSIVEIVLFLILEVVLREELLKNMKHKVRDSRTRTGHGTDRKMSDLCESLLKYWNWYWLFLRPVWYFNLGWKICYWEISF